MTGTDERWRLGHRPALDGLRGVAILLVIVGHLNIEQVQAAGSVGVTVFFTLSGFLITSLLLEQIGRGGIRFGAFYARRARRLMPALLITVALSTLITLVRFGGIPDPRLTYGALTYTSNWLLIGGEYPGTGLGHTWSLSIEEQFYLVWPVTLLLVVKLARRWALFVLFGGAIGSLLLRDHFWATAAVPWARNYYGFDTRADALLIGCALALFMHGRRECTPVRAIGLLGVALVALACLFKGYGEYVALSTVAACGAAAMLWVAAQGTPWRWLTWRPLRTAGRLSYGYYLLESVVGVIPVYLLGNTTTVRLFLMVPLSWAAAALMWRYVERPILRPAAGRDRADQDRAERADDRAGGGYEHVGDRPGPLGQVPQRKQA